jgi:hypothetical protein
MAFRLLPRTLAHNYDRGGLNFETTDGRQIFRCFVFEDALQDVSGAARRDIGTMLVVFSEYKGLILAAIDVKEGNGELEDGEIVLRTRDLI